MRGFPDPARALSARARISTSVGAIAAAFLLASCGGSSSDAPAAAAPAPAVQLSGVAATGAPMAGATIAVTCANGSSFTTTAAAGGTWAVDVKDATVLPCVVKATGGTPPVTLHSIATAVGTVNVTPLTNLVVASAAGADPADWLAANSGTKLAAALTAAVAKLPAAETAVVGSLKAAGFSVPTGSLLTASFTPKDGDPLDDLLESVNKSLAASGTTYDDFVDKVAAAGTTTVTVPKLDVVTAAQMAAQPRLNGGGVTVANGVATMSTTADAANPVGAFFGGGTGNKSVLQIPGLAGTKLKDIKEIQLEFKANSALGTGCAQGTCPYVYINMMVDLDCGATPPANATALAARTKRRIVIFDPFYKFIQQDNAITQGAFTTITITPSTGGWRLSGGAVGGDNDLGVEEVQQGVQYNLTGFKYDTYPNACIVDGVSSADGGLYRDKAADPACDTATALTGDSPAKCGKPHAGFLLNLGDSNTKTVSNWDIRKVKVNDRIFTFE